MGLIGQNKSFLHLTTGVLDSVLLRRFSLNIPNKTISLGDDIGEIPLLTIGDSKFPRLE